MQMANFKREKKIVLWPFDPSREGLKTVAWSTDPVRNEFVSPLFFYDWFFLLNHLKKKRRRATR